MLLLLAWILRGYMGIRGCHRNFEWDGCCTRSGKGYNRAVDGWPAVFAGWVSDLVDGMVFCLQAQAREKVAGPASIT